MQLRELRAFVKRSGWKIFDEYIDQGYTGSNTKRPAFTDMMIAAQKRKFDVLLVWKLDRLSRSLKDWSDPLPLDAKQKKVSMLTSKAKP